MQGTRSIPGLGRSHGLWGQPGHALQQGLRPRARALEPVLVTRKPLQRSQLSTARGHSPQPEACAAAARPSRAKDSFFKKTDNFSIYSLKPHSSWSLVAFIWSQTTQSLKDLIDPVQLFEVMSNRTSSCSELRSSFMTTVPKANHQYQRLYSSLD